MKRKAVFLDRDGVINRTHFRDGKPRAPARLEEFELLPGVEEAVRDLKKAGFVLIVVTNQPDVARGWLKREAADAMNQRVRELLPVDEVRACFHDDADDCSCRKPKPGMLLQSGEAWDIDFQSSYMVGDRAGDIVAGKAVGCKTLLVGEGDRPCEPEARVASLLEAAKWILKRC